MDISLLHMGFFRLQHRFKKLYMAPVFGGLSRGAFFALETLRQDSFRNPEAEGMYASALADRRSTLPRAARPLKRAGRFHGEG